MKLEFFIRGKCINMGCFISRPDQLYIRCFQVNMLIQRKTCIYQDRKVKKCLQYSLNFTINLIGNL